MGIYHLGSFIFGGLLMGASKLFWLSACEVVAEDHEFFDPLVCEGFQDFFFLAGIIIMVIALIGMFRKK